MVNEMSVEILTSPEEPSAIENHLRKVSGLDEAALYAINVKDTFDTAMEGVAMFLDLVGQVEYTYTTKTGNKVHGVLNSP